MANLADTEVEPTNKSSLTSEDDETLDPRVQVSCSSLFTSVSSFVDDSLD